MRMTRAESDLTATTDLLQLSSTDPWRWLWNVERILGDRSVRVSLRVVVGSGPELGVRARDGVPAWVRVSTRVTVSVWLSTPEQTSPR